MPSSLQVRFDSLCRKAHACRTCPELAEKTAVLSKLNGSLSPRVFFIAEAPGRQGADRTRKPFYGDKSGENFQTLLDSIGLLREDIFITNSVLCSPRTTTGANRKPKRSEIVNCSSFLSRTIDLIRPNIVATLGRVALDALRLIEDHPYKLKTHAGMVQRWRSINLVPLYHPSPQVIAAQRGLDMQLRHFGTLAKLI